MASKRVVVTGIGAVTPLANNAAGTWRRLCRGESGIGPLTLFDASRFPTRIAGEIKDFRPVSGLINGVPLGRNSLFALEAGGEAMRDAGLFKGLPDPSRLGIYFGAGDGGCDFPVYSSVISDAVEGSEGSVNADSYIKLSLSRLVPKKLLEQEPFQAVQHLAEAFGAEGPVSNCLTACAASSQAIGEAVEMIRRGTADVMLSGGTHSMIHPLGLAGFNLLTALSTSRNDDPKRASRPFDKSRDGFVLSEGSGVVVLEELEHAKHRGAKIYGEIVGYGCSADAFRLTDPHSEGRGANQAMRLALENAHLNVSDIDYVNAHGTSTQLNDQVETLAVKKVFGDHAKNVPISSIKSMLGHMIAAAGAVELIASLLTLRDGIIPPTINYETPDPACDLDYVPNVARKQKVDTVLSNSFGFGGQNVSLIVRVFHA